MPAPNLACKTCGTKVFKSPGEVDDHHKEAHPEVEAQNSSESQDQSNKQEQE